MSQNESDDPVIVHFQFLLHLIFWKGQGRIYFLEFYPFFYFEFKNTSNLIFPDFKVPSESFLFKNFETGLTFCHM